MFIYVCMLIVPCSSATYDELESKVIFSNLSPFIEVIELCPASDVIGFCPTSDVIGLCDLTLLLALLEPPFLCN